MCERSTRGKHGGLHMPQGTLHALGTIMRTEGMAGLFRGLGPTIVSNAPYSAFYYLFYTSLQQRMQQVGLRAAGLQESSHAPVQGKSCMTLRLNRRLVLCDTSTSSQKRQPTSRPGQWRLSVPRC